ncbi:superinfection immunity protein [Aureimonas altamirensis]|uniref:superinfection immunity protein n=1 Tax=Aureimonas altamirensis TaxID=370622 RepID=UPI0020371D7B|nr:superinfection immunity protein [Aureimonas altamirensis]MCM2505420.1 superinfection immunity protein [Aureimonas altamirensis]
MTDEELGILMIIGLVIFIGFLPVFIAFVRGHPNRWLILILTVVAGATLVGWLIALIWSINAIYRSQGPIANGGESGLNLFANDVPARATEPKVPHPAPPNRKGAPVEAIAGQLERLAQLHQTGWLTDTEFASAKSALLARL